MSSLASSTKFRNFAVAFAVVVPVLYVCCDWFGLPTFTYHPATNLVEWGRTAPRSGGGPVMYWYGWLVTTLIGATVIGWLATLLPDATIKKIPLALAWILPIVALPILVYTLMPFWTK